MSANRDWPRYGEKGWCLFLDRDGVLNRRVVGDYVRTPDQFEWLSGAADATAMLGDWAPYVVVVTNQQGVGKGLVDDADLDEIHERMRQDVRGLGGRIDAVLVCPHRASDGCGCRKPEPGLVLDWLAAHPDVDPARCVVVGDSESDIAMGRVATGGLGCCVLIDDASGPGSDADYRFASFADFATWVSVLTPSLVRA